MKINSSSKSGFTLVEIMIVVAIIGTLAGIAIPSFIRARSESQTTACINNLRQIDTAKQQWALERNKRTSVTPQQADLDPYLSRYGNATHIACPAAGKSATFGDTYSINALNDLPTCNVVSAAHVLD